MEKKEISLSRKADRPGVPFEPDPKFRIFMEAAPDAIVIVDHEGTIVMINSLTEKLFGYSREELLGNKVDILIPEKLQSAHIGHHVDYFHDPKTRRMGEGQALTGRRKTGDEFPIEISLSPLDTEQGKLVISIVRDITSRRQLEAKFRGLLESAPDGIVVVGNDAKIVIVNSQTEKMFGYSRDELVGQHIEILVPEKFKNSHVNHRTGYINHPVTRPMGAGRALTGKKKDGTEFPVEISLSPLETEQGTLITSIVRDITDRRRTEEQLKSSLREKEALLKEIHHRVKNNLQVTSSLLKLQSDYIPDQAAKEIFAESQNRIRSMALVHEKLYGSSDLSQINFSEYAESLAQLLFRSFGVDKNKIALCVGKTPVFLSIETAVPCGLIVNELLSNCLKHAFPDGHTGEIFLSIEKTDAGKVKIKTADNGIGLPKNFDFEKAETLGLQLVRTLVRQIDGEITVNRSIGTEFIIAFTELRGAK